MNRILEAPALLEDYGALAIPGGFSYGDDVAAGTILATELTEVLGDALRAFVDRGGLMLGICNGFQALVKTGLLPGQGRRQRDPRDALVERLAPLRGPLGARPRQRDAVRVHREGRRDARAARGARRGPLPDAVRRGPPRARARTATSRSATSTPRAARPGTRTTRADRRTASPASATRPAGSSGSCPTPSASSSRTSTRAGRARSHAREGDGLSIFRAAVRALRS